jgi:hypothetical protein
MRRLRRTEAVAGAAVLAAASGMLLLQVATFRPAVHGAPATFAVSWLLALAGAILAAGWALARRTPAWVAGLLVLGVVLPGFVVHARRWQERQAPLRLDSGTPQALRQAVEPTLRGQSTLQLEPDGLSLRAPAGSIGYVEVRPLTADTVPWDLPRALLALPGPATGTGEEYAWRTSVALDGRFFILLETDRLLVQLTPTGLQLDASGRPAQARSRPAGWAAPQEWVLRRAGGRTTQLVGGEVVGTEADTGPFRYVRLGETRSDGDHGGTLRLHALRQRRFRT